MTVKQEELVLSDPQADMPCECCGAAPAEVLLPIGERALFACWRCAHVVTEHEIDPSNAPQVECGCAPEVVFPRWS